MGQGHWYGILDGQAELQSSESGHDSILIYTCKFKCHHKNVLPPMYKMEKIARARQWHISATSSTQAHVNCIQNDEGKWICKPLATLSINCNLQLVKLKLVVPFNIFTYHGSFSQRPHCTHQSSVAS